MALYICLRIRFFYRSPPPRSSAAHVVVLWSPLLCPLAFSFDRMPHSFGYRAHTRDLFQKKFRKHGLLPTQTYLKIFKVGQIVDLAGDGGVHKGKCSRNRCSGAGQEAALWVVGSVLRT